MGRLSVFLQKSLIPALFVFGAAAIIRGAHMIYPPAAFMVGGALLISIAIGIVTAK